MVVVVVVVGGDRCGFRGHLMPSAGARAPRGLIQPQQKLQLRLLLFLLHPPTTHTHICVSTHSHIYFGSPPHLLSVWLIRSDFKMYLYVARFFIVFAEPCYSKVFQSPTHTGFDTSGSFFTCNHTPAFSLSFQPMLSILCCPFLFLCVVPLNMAVGFEKLGCSVTHVLL